MSDHPIDVRYELAAEEARHCETLKYNEEMRAALLDCRARLAESERWLRKVVDDHYMVPQARRYLARLTDSAELREPV